MQPWARPSSLTSSCHRMAWPPGRAWPLAAISSTTHNNASGSLSLHNFNFNLKFREDSGKNSVWCSFPRKQKGKNRNTLPPHACSPGPVLSLPPPTPHCACPIRTFFPNTLSSSIDALCCSTPTIGSLAFDFTGKLVAAPLALTLAGRVKAALADTGSPWAPVPPAPRTPLMSGAPGFGPLPSSFGAACIRVGVHAG